MATLQQVHCACIFPPQMHITQTHAPILCHTTGTHTHTQSHIYVHNCTVCSTMHDPRAGASTTINSRRLIQQCRTRSRRRGSYKERAGERAERERPGRESAPQRVAREKQSSKKTSAATTRATGKPSKLTDRQSHAADRQPHSADRWTERQTDKDRETDTERAYVRRVIVS